MSGLRRNFFNLLLVSTVTTSTAYVLVGSTKPTAGVPFEIGNLDTSHARITTSPDCESESSLAQGPHVEATDCGPGRGNPNNKKNCRFTVTSRKSHYLCVCSQEVVLGGDQGSYCAKYEWLQPAFQVVGPSPLPQTRTCLVGRPLDRLGGGESSTLLLVGGGFKAVGQDKVVIAKSCGQVSTYEEVNHRIDPETKEDDTQSFGRAAWTCPFEAGRFKFCWKSSKDPTESVYVEVGMVIIIINIIHNITNYKIFEALLIIIEVVFFNLGGE